MFILLKNDKPLLRSKYWEDLENFVEELKDLNKNYVDRREFKKIKKSNEIMKQWNRK